MHGCCLPHDSKTESGKADSDVPVRRALVRQSRAGQGGPDSHSDRPAAPDGPGDPLLPLKAAERADLTLATVAKSAAATDPATTPSTC